MRACQKAEFLLDGGRSVLAPTELDSSSLHQGYIEKHSEAASATL